MNYIDTHAHIYLEEFDADRAAVIERAKAAGISHIILPNVDNTSIKPMLELEASEPGFFHAAMGLHPTSVQANYQEELALIKSQLEKQSFCAIGEIGIDLYWDKTYIKEQIIVFEQQIQWAIDLDLPLIIHVRDAFPEALASVQKLNCEGLRGIFHSFGGTIKDAETIMEFGGFKLGINGVVTFKNSGLAETLKSIPLDYIVLETDAPYLSPAPFRGKRNEPAHLSYIVDKFTEIYQQPRDFILKKTSENALHVFKTIIFATD
jgi:TatD DNase family protein